jgi:3-oxoadipate CoA-transferase, beta subunit
MTLFTKDQIAARIARDIPEGAYVNLGIGMPTLVANHIAPDREVILQSENGILGMGGAPSPELEDFDLINAGKQAVTIVAGGAYFHSADSFAMMRAGHIDICVLGAFQVSLQGDIANWHAAATLDNLESIPAVGGAMDLATGARQTWVMMDLFTKQGVSKLVKRCTYALTGLSCVKRVYSDHAIFALDDGVVTILEAAPGFNAQAFLNSIG